MIGLDFNDGHIDLAETDGRGNLVAMDRYRLKYHGTGGRAANEMRQVTAEIGKYALSKGKSIVKEELSFIKKKKRSPRQKRDRAGVTTKCFIRWIIRDMRTI